VAVSGIVTESQARECLRLGALDFVGKPVPLERLQDVLTYLEPHAIHRTREPATQRVERRQAPRVRATIPVSIREYRGSAWEGTSVEISVSGMKAQTDAALAVGTAVKCAFTLPDGGEPIDVISIVGRRDTTGTVLAFVNLPDHEQRRLADFVRRTSR
jgi:hypothetical protein